MAELAKAAARQLPGFKLGKKEVFLPNHVITFLRKEKLPPNEASFQVPIRFTKFDLRDYLWNLYNVEVRKVRVYLKVQPLKSREFQPRSFYRPKPLKIMTVELARPFQWPEVPENLEPWAHSLWKRRQESQNEESKSGRAKMLGDLPLKSKQPLSQERKDLAGLARKLLAGEVKWTNDVILDPKWDELLEDKPRGKAVEAASEEIVEAEASAAEANPKDPVGPR